MSIRAVVRCVILLTASEYLYCSIIGNGICNLVCNRVRRHQYMYRSLAHRPQPTSSSRGLGLEMVRQLVESPQNVVFATCRNPESATLLNKLKSTAKGKLHVLKLDLSDHSTIKNCASHLQDVVGAGGIDYLINNAGIVSLLSLASAKQTGLTASRQPQTPPSPPKQSISQKLYTLT